MVQNNSDHATRIMTAIIRKEVLKELLPFCSRDEIRYILCGISLEADGKEITATACDGRRLLSVSWDSPVPAFKTVVPASLLALAMQIKGVELGFTFETQTEFKGTKFKADFCEFAELGIGGASCRQKQVEGNFPNWKQAVPEAKNEGVEALRAMRVNWKHLIDFNKAFNFLCKGNSPVIYCAGENQPISFTLNAGEFRIIGVLMPVMLDKLNGGGFR